MAGRRQCRNCAAGLPIAIDCLRRLAPPIEDVLASVRVEALGERQSRLVAAKMRAETGGTVPQVVMPMSGRVLAS